MPAKKRNDRHGKIVIEYSSDGSYVGSSRTVPPVLSDDDANSANGSGSFQRPITKHVSKVQHNYTTGETAHPNWVGGVDQNGVDDGAV